MSKICHLGRGEVVTCKTFVRDGGGLVYGGYRVLDRPEPGAYAATVYENGHAEEAWRMPVLGFIERGAGEAQVAPTVHTEKIWSARRLVNGDFVSCGGHGEICVSRSGGKPACLGRFDAQVVMAVCEVPGAGEIAAACGWDCVVRVLGPKGVRELAGHEQSSHNMMIDVAVSGDGRRLASGDAIGVVKLWDVESGACLETLWPQEGETARVALDGRGRWLVRSSSTGRVALWDLAARRLVHRWGGYRSPVWCVALAQGGTHAAAGYHDGTARLWDTERGDELLCLRGEGPVLALAFGEDAAQLFVAVQRGPERCIDVATGIVSLW